MDIQEALKILSITNNQLDSSTLEEYYKKARSKAHPDKGGTPEHFQKVTAAYDYLKQILKDSNDSNHGYNNSESNYYYDSNNINPNKEAFERLQRVIYDLRGRITHKDAELFSLKNDYASIINTLKESNYNSSLRISELLKEIERLKSKLNNKKDKVGLSSKQIESLILENQHLKQQLNNQNKTTPQNKQSFFTRIMQWIKK